MMGAAKGKVQKIVINWLFNGLNKVDTFGDSVMEDASLCGLIALNIAGR